MVIWLSSYVLGNADNAGSLVTIYGNVPVKLLIGLGWVRF